MWERADRDFLAPAPFVRIKTRTIALQHGAALNAELFLQIVKHQIGRYYATRRIPNGIVDAICFAGLDGT